MSKPRIWKNSRIWRLQVGKWDLVGFGLSFLLVVCMGFLLVANYSSQLDLRGAALEQIRHDVEKRATAVSYFYSERRNDIEELAAGRVIATFFENKALGMSMEYGLRVSLFAISEAFQRLMEKKRLDGVPIYTRVAFVEAGGTPLVDALRPGLGAGTFYEMPWDRLLCPNCMSTEIAFESEAPDLRPMISVPYFFKNQYTGQIVAWVSEKTVQENLVAAAGDSSRRWVRIVPGDPESPARRAELSLEFKDVEALERDGFAESKGFHEVLIRSENERAVAISVPVAGTPFTLAAAFPVSEVYGRTAPWYLLVALGTFAILVLVGMVIVTRVNVRNLLLSAHLDEASRRKAEVEEKNTLLEKEIAYRLRAEKELRESQSFLQATLDALPSHVAILDQSGTIVAVNAAWRHFAEADGWPPDEFGVGAPYLRLYESRFGGGEGRADDVVRGIGEVMRDRREYFYIEYPVTANGILRWFIVRATSFGMGGLTRVVVSHEDVTVLKLAEEALRKSEERYALAARAANDGLWDWNLVTGKLYLSARWKTMIGYEDAEVGTSPDEWFHRIHADDLQRIESVISSHVTAETDHFAGEYRMLHRDGTYRWMLTRGIAVRDSKDNVYRVVGSQTDITERRQAESQLLHSAFHDGLTGLPNRALFLDRLGRAMERAKRHQKKYGFAVLYLDLDRFKIVNDSLGHSVGDELLVAMARNLECCIRSCDTVARLGGDEFAILLDEISEEHDARHIAERIHDELSVPMNIAGHEIFTTASIGIALSSSGYTSPEDFLRDADTAMYRAKAQGRSRYQIFDKTMHARMMELLRLENDLRRAIERREFVVHYQPIVSLKTGVIAGFEALVRWRHPQRGLLPPSEFLGVAEEAGLIAPIDIFVLNEACMAMQRWNERFASVLSFTISVNIAGNHFSQPGLLDQLHRVLSETGLDPHSLKLEITEGAIMESVGFPSPLLVGLKELGVGLQIDDFGSGYSSLSRLHCLPIDTLKIDRAFISTVENNNENFEIARTIATLAHSLGMDVIAEGIETIGQMVLLRQLECEYGQGYLFSRALEETEAANFIAAFGKRPLTRAGNVIAMPGTNLSHAG